MIKCEQIQTCKFYTNFHENPEVVKQGWIISFCSYKRRSEKCERKKQLKETGTEPPDNVAPTGTIMLM